MVNFFRSLVSLLVVGLAFGTLNVFQILSAALGIFSKKAMRASLFFLAQVCSDFCVWWLIRVYGYTPKLEIDKIPPGENAVLICNHQAFADVVVIMHFASLFRRVGHLKFFVKDSLKWLPGPGWSLWFYDSIFLKRNWDSDTAKINRMFSHIKTNNLPFWIVTFPEGTRATPKKLAASSNYMSALGLEPFKHHLCPRTKGFWATTEHLKDRIDAVYDLTIDYHTPHAPSFWSFLAAKKPALSLRVKRYAFKEIPTTQEAQKKWLIDRFREKDQRQ
jgi:lysocardiolipin and lysophospholipid acyltransferase